MFVAHYRISLSCVHTLERAKTFLAAMTVWMGKGEDEYYIKAHHGYSFVVS